MYIVIFCLKTPYHTCTYVTPRLYRFKNHGFQTSRCVVDHCTTYGVCLFRWIRAP